MGATRTEHDTLGTVEVPVEALYGAQTARAAAIPISGWVMPARFLAALAGVKAAFARAHGEAGRLPPEVAAAVAAAAGEVAAGRHLEHFPVDVFQTGSGTSSNMNVNEVVAHLADRALGGEAASHRRVHPNDHVNLGQSSNDAVPAALRLAVAGALRDELGPALAGVVAGLQRLAAAEADTVVLGRTHLQDAVPTTFGRVFGAWGERLEGAAGRLREAGQALLDLPLGGTAVGTGLGADRDVVARAVSLLGEATGLELRVLGNPAVAMAGQEAAVAVADALAGLGRVLLALANDLRLRASGPFGGLAEVALPAVQPGSSIMPGKVNPVVPEVVAQVAVQVEGLAAACRGTVALQQLELHHGLPLLAWNLDTMVRLLAGACRALAARCLAGLAVDRARARALASSSPALATALAARVGYERAAAVAVAAQRSGGSVVAAARSLAVLPDAELGALLDLDRMASGG